MDGLSFGGGAGAFSLFFRACRSGDGGSNWRRICWSEASREWTAEDGFGGGDGGERDDGGSAEDSKGSSEAEADEEGCMVEQASKSRK